VSCDLSRRQDVILFFTISNRQPIAGGNGDDQLEEEEEEKKENDLFRKLFSRIRTNFFILLFSVLNIFPRDFFLFQKIEKLTNFTK